MARHIHFLACTGIMSACCALSSCLTARTAYVRPELPAYDPAVPVRPTLDVIDQEPDPAVTRNLILVTQYAKELEAYGQGWRDFYKELRGDADE